MAKLRHIAISVDDPEAEAEFFVRTFGMQRVGTTDSSLANGCYVSDGVINLALLKFKSDAAAGEERGKDFVGLHHIGFQVDDLDSAREKVKENGGNHFMGEPIKRGLTFYEEKWYTPAGVMFDISHTGWSTAPADAAAKAAEAMASNDD